MEFQQLQQTNAESAFVTEVLAVNVVRSCLMDNGGGSNSDGCVVGNGDPSTCTEDAFDAALAGGGSVRFDCGGSPVTISITHETDITKDTSIDGGNLITLSGGGVTQIFGVTPGVSLTLANLTISNGFAPEGGGAILNTSTLTVTNCTFSGNNARGGAGTVAAIENLGDAATLTVTNSTFSDNTGDGGSIENDGGTLMVTTSTFSDNHGGGAGAISNSGIGTLMVSSSTFSGNATGAIFSSGTLIVSNCTFAGNSAGTGGAIYGNGMVAITNTTFSANSAAVAGGALYSDGKLPVTVVVTNSTFAGNSMFASAGAAIANDTVGGSVVLRNTIVFNSVGGANCQGSITDGGHNLDSSGSCGFTSAMGSLNDTDPQLDPAGLANNGGPTQTIALQPGSPAIEAGNAAVCAAPPVNGLDQRSFHRSAAGCSIGAYESDVLDTCCQCPSSCAAPVNGSCGACVAVMNATCESGELCVLQTPTPTPSPTATRPTQTPTRSATHTPITPSPTRTVTPTPTLGTADCCQCANFCAAPIVGSCGGCAVVREASCSGSTCIPVASALLRTRTSTPTSTPTPRACAGNSPSCGSS